MTGFIIVPNVIIDLDISSLNSSWLPIISTQSLLHWYILVKSFGSQNAIAIFDHLCFFNSYCLYFHLSWSYKCDIYNLITGPLHMLVTNNLLTIHSRRDLICTYNFSYITYFLSYYGNPILSPYITSCIGFRPPLIEPIYICAK